MTVALPIPSAAALTSYDELVTTIGLYMNRSDLTDIIPSFVATCEAEMNRRLALKPVRPMHVRSTLSLSSEYIAAPVDILDIDEMEVAGYWQVLSTSPQNMARMKEDLTAYLAQLQGVYGTSLVPPKYYAQVGAQLRLFPAPEVSFTADIVYWERLSALTSDNQSNWLLEDHPDAYLTGVLSYGYAYEKNPESRDFWLNLFDTVMEKVLAAYPSRPDNAPLVSEIGAGRLARSVLA